MKEVWEVQADIAATTAKIEYLKNAENSVTNDNVVTKDPMNVYCEEMLNKTPLSATNTRSKAKTDFSCTTLHSPKGDCGFKTFLSKEQ